MKESVLAAAQAGGLEKLRMLLTEGADLSARDRNNNTALMRAVSGDHTEVVDILRDDKIAGTSFKSETFHGIQPSSIIFLTIRRICFASNGLLMNPFAPA